MQVLKNSPGVFPGSFNSPSELKPRLTLVTGQRGSGKTRWCMELAEYARTIGLELRGLVSPAVIDGETKVGIDLLDLGSGERRRLAFRKGDVNGDLSTSDWQMVAGTLDWGNALLERIQSCEIFILDEIGPLEFEQGIGFLVGMDFVDTHKEVPSFVVVRPALLPAARRRWPWADVLDVHVEAGA